MKASGSPWTAAKIDELTDMVNEGRLSFGQIGNAMGMSRGAVIGKARRLGIYKSSPPRKARQRMSAASKHYQASQREARPNPRPYRSKPDIEPLGTNEWPESGFCKWPHGHPKEANFKFCARPIEGSPVYCAHHVARAHEKPWKQRAA